MTASIVSPKSRTVVVAAGFGTATVNGSMPGALSPIPPSPSGRAWTSVIRGYSRCVMARLSPSTTRYLRSPAIPHGSTAASPSAGPWTDLTG